MSVIPIDEAAIASAERAYYDHLDKHGETGSSLSDLLTDTVCAYLEAVGARVERSAAALYHRETHERLVTDWKPLTDTEEER